MRNFVEEQKFHSEVLGFDLSKVEQGTPEWHRSRAGVVTASKAHLLLMGRKTQGRATYMDSLLGAIATGRLPDEVNAKTLQWGKDYEEEARQAYSGQTFEIVNDTGFIFQDDSMRAGISPDGLIQDKPKGLELKCPFSSGVFMAFAGRGEIKKEEVAQYQFSLLVTEFDTWGFAKYDPRNINCKKLHFIEVERDEKMIANLSEGLEMFLEDMDEALKNLGMEFGQQWSGEM